MSKLSLIIKISGHDHDDVRRRLSHMVTHLKYFDDMHVETKDGEAHYSFEDPTDKRPPVRPPGNQQKPIEDRILTLLTEIKDLLK